MTPAEFYMVFGAGLMTGFAAGWGLYNWIILRELRGDDER